MIHRNIYFLPAASAGLGFAFGVAVAAFAVSCSDTAPNVTYIGVVDATPPRLGRSSDDLSGGNGEIDASSAGERLDAGTRADASP